MRIITGQINGGWMNNPSFGSTVRNHDLIYDESGNLVVGQQTGSFSGNFRFDSYALDSSRQVPTSSEIRPLNASLAPRVHR